MEIVKDPAMNGLDRKLNFYQNEKSQLKVTIRLDDKRIFSGKAKWPKQQHKMADTRNYKMAANKNIAREVVFRLTDKEVLEVNVKWCEQGILG